MMWTGEDIAPFYRIEQDDFYASIEADSRASSPDVSAMPPLNQPGFGPERSGIGGMYGR